MIDFRDAAYRAQVHARIGTVTARRCRMHERGAALVELALTLPVMLLMLFYTLDIGLAVSTRSELVMAVREALDREGFEHVRIVVSGGFKADKIRAFEAAGVPVDAYGVGSSLIRGANDFTADVVMVDGRPCAKVGRQLNPSSRLEVVA